MRGSFRRAIAALALLAAAVVFSMGMGAQVGVQAAAPQQLPTGSLATVTSTPQGPVVVVAPNSGETQANLRAGPHQMFERVGVLLLGQSAPVVGRSAKGEWYQVLYAGAPGGKAWVYAYIVELQPATAQLPIVEAPPDPTMAVAATIDPTLAARFEVTIEPTHLPTFTPAPPLVIPTFTDASTAPTGGIPMGMVILGLAAVGLFLGIVAFSTR